MTVKDKIGHLLESVDKKCARSLAKLLTYIEKHGISTLACKELLVPKKESFRLGVTGPPGAGKSTLINLMVSEFRAKGLSVGVLAIDPSSPISGGAILGDRIRYKDHFLDEKVFIRSLGTRGSLGGLCSSAYLMLRAYDLFGFDRVIVETVGVGQSELDIVNVADHVSILLVPESGDSIQMMKAGILEVADSFVINKSDRPGAESLKVQLKSELSYSHKDMAKQIFSVVALENKNVGVYTEYINKICGDKLKRQSPNYLKREARALLSSTFQSILDEKTQNITTVEQFRLIIEHEYKKITQSIK